MCTGTIVNLAGAAAQIITLTDNEAPAIQIPGTAPVIIGTGTTNCLSGQSVNFPNTSDNCAVSIRTLKIGGATFTAASNGTVNVFGLPLGNYCGIWSASDACGNTTRIKQNFTVKDIVAPIAVADQNTNVSMTLDCTATINASSFDDGSLDNCCLDVNRFEVARMNADGSAGTFAPSITFTKADLNGDCSNTLQVVFRVWDCNGNSNTAMVNVKLEDKIGPSAAGKDTTVMCGNDALADQWLKSWESRFSAIGLLDYPPVNGTNPGYFDNCSASVSWSAISGSIDQCGNGFRTRTATITDKCGKSTTATFKYTSGQQALFAVTLPPNEKANCPGTGVTTKADAIAKARASLKVYEGCPVVAGYSG
ncbi:MAG: hypothetical protein ACOYOA_12290, partial [Saprospiraceae bacterium]